MRLLGRINQIERKVMAIKGVMDNTIEIPIGVWYSDLETGEVIQDSGPTCRVPIEQKNAFGVMLVPAPCDKATWPKVIAKCEAYQAQLQSEIE